ncbi:DUF2155 domain-containing protein [Yoonia sp. 208BN28-4]|uniref:DUF2155 domain-containing protein n=1 Tax=Yoonia sp. 208BN28-4 TaxID=3126505 RepID=UPI0030A52A3F
MMKAVAICLAMLPMASVAQQATSGSGGDLRILDKVNGEVTDLTMAVGESRRVGHLNITMEDCRYPSANPSGDAFAALNIWYRDDNAPVFTGWLVASSPALYAMEHPRYDVWVLRCSTS